MSIPEHPEIACALTTGYPKPPREVDPVNCSECSKELTDNDTVYDYDGEALCSNCCLDRITEDFEVSEIAEALGIPKKSAADYAAEHFEN